MRDARYRVLLVGSHPVQYAAPLFRQMAEHPQLDILVAYCSLQGAEPGVDPQFGVPITWDIPLLEGYPWVHIPNKSPKPGIGRFFGLLNPGLWKLVRTGRFDAVVIFTGYVYASFWITVSAAKGKRTALLFVTDAHELRPLDGRRWKVPIKRWLWPRLFRLADKTLALSSAGVTLMRSLGLPNGRVALLPYVVYNDWWLERAAAADREAVRAEWGVAGSDPVILFCAKLQPWKRPLDVLRAFAKASMPQAVLVYAGAGPLRAQLETEAAVLGMAERVRFLGFVNQSRLPAIYRAADLLVLPSESEAFGLVVNEAMLCGCPVAVSDRVGARHDLVRPGETGFVFPCGDVEALAGILRNALPDRARLQALGVAARRRMETWSPREYIQALVQAIESAVQSNTGAPGERAG